MHHGLMYGYHHLSNDTLHSTIQQTARKWRASLMSDSMDRVQRLKCNISHRSCGLGCFPWQCFSKCPANHCGSRKGEALSVLRTPYVKTLRNARSEGAPCISFSVLQTIPNVILFTAILLSSLSFQWTCERFEQMTEATRLDRVWI